MPAGRKAAPRIHKSPTRALARVGDPLVDANGKVVPPDGYVKPKVAREIAASQTVDPSGYRPTKKRNLKELPGDPKTLNAVSVVFMYTMLGVGDREISELLGASTTEVQQVRDHSAYGECFQAILGEFINANSDLLTSRIAAYSQTAIQTVGELIENGKKEEVRLRASTDMLDRAGVRAKDQVERQQGARNDLRIIVVDGDNTTVNVNVSTNFDE